MNKDLLQVKWSIEHLHNRIVSNNLEADRLQTFLEFYPQRDNLTSSYENYIHLVKEDISSIRKLETFYKKYYVSYISKPEYPGEERDNVNTYLV